MINNSFIFHTLSIIHCLSYFRILYARLHRNPHDKDRINNRSFWHAEQVFHERRQWRRIQAWSSLLYPRETDQISKVSDTRTSSALPYLVPSELHAGERGRRAKIASKTVELSHQSQENRYVIQAICHPALSSSSDSDTYPERSAPRRLANTFKPRTKPTITPRSPRQYLT